jgi:hypothetical protein
MAQQPAETPASSPQPTGHELEMARLRQQIADRQALEYGEAEAVALETLGPGWTPWMKLLLIDSDHRRTGNTEPVAVAYKVCRGKEPLSNQSVYLRRMPDGTVRKADTCEEVFGDLLHEPHPTRTLELLHGQVVPAPRWTLCWSALERYEPQSAERLAAGRVKREAKAVEKAAEDNPLFAEQIKAGEWRPEKKRKGRTP